MATPLTHVKGVGLKIANVLQAHGIDSVETLASADIGTLAALPGLGDVRSQQIHQAAIELIAAASVAATPPGLEVAAEPPTLAPIPREDRSEEKKKLSTWSQPQPGKKKAKSGQQEEGVLAGQGPSLIQKKAKKRKGKGKKKGKGHDNPLWSQTGEELRPAGQGHSPSPKKARKPKKQKKSKKPDKPKRSKKSHRAEQADEG
jgi:colicin import membrane protein